MCLIIDEELHRNLTFNHWKLVPKPFVATDNMLVYKKLLHYKTYDEDDLIMTPTMKEVLTLGPKNRRCLLEAREPCNGKNRYKFVVNGGNEQDLSYFYVTNGIHSYASALRFTQIKKFLPTEKGLSNTRWYEMHYAIIPIGTRFYFGLAGDVVSEKLLVMYDYQDYFQFNDSSHPAEAYTYKYVHDKVF